MQFNQSRLMKPIIAQSNEKLIEYEYQAREPLERCPSVN